MTTLKKRGRPSKTSIKLSTQPVLVQMDNIKFNDDLFVPMLIGNKLDEFFSSDRGLMRGCNYAFVGDPGVGKSTILLDVLSGLQKNNYKVLFISAEMTSIDLYGYIKRYPKFGSIPILFLGDYHDENPLEILEKTLKEGWDVILVDSMAEVTTQFTDYFGGTYKSSESKILNLFDRHNKAYNDNNKNATFLIIQQVTKQGNFAGSNRFKHILTGMAYLKYSEGSRFIFFDKNRRGGCMDCLFFNFDSKNSINWLHTSPVNEI